jgi:hypothetical protein
MEAMAGPATAAINTAHSCNATIVEMKERGPAMAELRLRYKYQAEH